MAENVLFNPSAGNVPPPAQPVVQNPQVTPQQPVQAPGQAPAAFSPPVQPVQVQSVNGAPPSILTPPSGTKPGLSKELIKKIAIGVGAFIGCVLLIIGITHIIALRNKPKDVTLTYWGLWEDKNVMQTIINDFEQKNPHIKVNYIAQNPTQTNPTYKDRLVTQIHEGIGPDIFRFHNSWTQSLYKVLLPLSTEAISPRDFTKAYYPVIQSDLLHNGAIYGVPLQIDTLALFINNDTFAAGNYTPPKSWNDFGTLASKLTVVDGSQNNRITNAGAAMGTFDNITHAPDIASLLFAQQGVDLKNISKSQQQISEALDYYTSFAQGSSGQPVVWQNELNPSIVMFTQGNLAMYFGYSWDIFTIDAQKPNFKYTIIPVPYLETPNGPIKTTIASYWVEGVSKQTKHPHESFLFMHYLTEQSTLEKLYSEESKQRPFGELYPRQDMASLLKDTRVHVFLDQAPLAVSTYFSSATYDNAFTGALNTYLSKAIGGILTGTSPDTAATDLISGFIQVYNAAQ